VEVQISLTRSELAISRNEADCFVARTSRARSHPIASRGRTSNGILQSAADWRSLSTIGPLPRRILPRPHWSSPCVTFGPRLISFLAEAGAGSPLIGDLEARRRKRRGRRSTLKKFESRLNLGLEDSESPAESPKAVITRLPLARASRNSRQIERAD